MKTIAVPLAAPIDGAKGKKTSLSLLTMAALISSVPASAGEDTNNVETKASQPESQPAWLSTNTAVNLSWRSFDFRPRLREAVVYDDNILFSTQNQQADVVNQLSPGVQIVGGDRSSLNAYQAAIADRNQSFELTGLTPSWLVLQSSEAWPGKFVLLDYSPRWQKFSHHSVNDSLDQFLTANAVWPMSKLVVGVRQDYRDERTVVTEAYTRSEVEQIHSELDAGYRLNDKFSVDTALERQGMEYPDSTNLTGYVEWKGTASLNRQIMDTFSVSLFVAGGMDQVGAGLDQTFERLGARVRYAYSQLFSLDGSAGVEDRQFDSGRSDTYSPFFSLGASYRPWERTYLRLGITRQQTASLNNGYFNTSTGGYLTLGKNFTDRFSLQTDLGYYQVDYTPIRNVANNSNPSDYYSVQLKGKVRLLKYMDAEAFYLFRGSGISQNDHVLQDNQCGVQLAFHY